MIDYSISCLLIMGLVSCDISTSDKTKALSDANLIKQQNNEPIANANTSEELRVDDTLLHNVNYKPKRIIEYKFEINNNDFNSFGFEKQQQGPSIGANQILINNDNLYLIDSYHSNIKKIAIYSGEVTSSVALNNLKGSLNSLTYFAGKLTVFSSESLFYTLDLDLKENKSIKISDYKRKKDVFNQTNDTISLFRLTFDFRQRKDNRVVVDLLKISKDYSFSNDSVLFDSYESFRNFTDFSVRGKKYNLKQLDENTRLMYNGRIYLLNKELPSTSKWYDTKNIDIENERIAFFEIDAKTIKITILLYN